MTHPLPHPEPAQVLAFDLVRAELNGDRGAMVDLIADASQTPGRLLDVLRCTAALAVWFGQRAHGDDLDEQLRHGGSHALGMAPLPEHPRASAAADIATQDGAA